MHERLKDAAMQERVRRMRDELVGLYRHSVMVGDVAHQLHPEDLPVGPRGREFTFTADLRCLCAECLPMGRLCCGRGSSFGLW